MSVATAKYPGCDTRREQGTTVFRSAPIKSLPFPSIRVDDVYNVRREMTARASIGPASHHSSARCADAQWGSPDLRRWSATRGADVCDDRADSSAGGDSTNPAGLDAADGPGAADGAGAADGNDGDLAAADSTDDRSAPGADAGDSEGGAPLDANGGGGDAADGRGNEGTEGGDAQAPPEGGGADAAADAAEAGDLLGGLVAFYRFDESSGTSAQDASGNNHTATLTGGASFSAGLNNNAVTLSGNGQYVALPTGIVSGLVSFSISTWVKLNATPPLWARVFDFGSGTNVYMFLTPNSGTMPRFAITTGGNAAEQQLGGTALSTGTWQHVVITLAGNAATFYVNGAVASQNAAMTLSPSSLASTTQNWLGRSQFAGDPFLNGQIDNFRIYSRALSASEVQQLYQQQQ
jgi:hypothetical protein